MVAARERLLPIALKPEEAAELIGVSRRTVYEMVAGGELPAIKIRNKTRIRRADLEAWLAAQPRHLARALDEDLDDETVDELLRTRGTH